MKIYEPSPETDELLLAWQRQLRKSGDLEDVFVGVYDSPSHFLGLFQGQTRLFYEADEAGLVWALWSQPFMSGASIALWARKDHRAGAWVPGVVWAMRQLFAHVPVVVFMALEPHVVRRAVASGFQILGRLPGLYKDRATTIGYLTRDEFNVQFPEQRSNGALPPRP